MKHNKAVGSVVDEGVEMSVPIVVFADNGPLSTDLPIKDGLEAAAKAKATNPDLGVVLLCDRTNVTPELLADETVDECLTYPYQKPALIRAITNLVDSEGSRTPG